MTASPDTPPSPPEKDTTIRKSQDSVDRARAARARLQNRRGSAKSKTRHLATGPDASRPHRSARRLSKIAPPPKSPPPPPQSAPAAHVEKELSTLEEKRLVKVLNKHFSKISEDIAHERAKTERALAEFNRKKEEFQARRRERDQSSSSSTTSPAADDALVGVERMLRDLHKRNEKIRRKEMDTKKLYSQYIKKYTLSQKTHAQENNELTKQSFIQTKTAMERSPHARNALRLDDIKAKQLTEFERAMMASPTKQVATTVRNIDTTVRKRGSDAGVVAPRVSSYDISPPLPPRQSSLSATDGGGGDYDAVCERVVRRHSENRLIYDEARKQRRGSSETHTTVSSDDDSAPFHDDVSCLTDTESKLEDILRRDLAQFELEYDAMDDWSVDSGLSSFAAEERRSVAALERATKEMSEVVSLASSVEEVTPAEERWMAYWSEEHQREYYYEVHSRRVSWDKPEGSVMESSDSFSDDGSVGSNSVGSSRSVLKRVSSVGSLPTVVESMPEDGVGGLKRRESRSLALERIRMRRRRRKRFIRRTFQSVLFLTIVMAIGYHYENEHVVRFVDVVRTYFENDVRPSQQLGGVSDSIPTAMVSEDVPVKKATGKKANIANMINDAIDHIKSPDPPAPAKVTEIKENHLSKVTPDVTEDKDEEISKDEIKKGTESKFKLPFHRLRKEHRDEEETTSEAEKYVVATETQERHPDAVIRTSKTNENSDTDLISNISNYIHYNLSPPLSDDNNNNISSKITTTNTISTNLVDTITETVALVLTTNQDKNDNNEQDPQSVLAKMPVKRPRRCFIPLIYIISGRCRRLARERPLFDLKALTDAIMQ